MLAAAVIASVCEAIQGMKASRGRPRIAGLYKAKRAERSAVIARRAAPRRSRGHCRSPMNSIVQMQRPPPRGPWIAASAFGLLAMTACLGGYGVMGHVTM